MSDDTRLIEVTTELVDTFGGRTLDGRRLSYEWGEPTATIGDERGITRDVYTPTMTVTDDGMAVIDRAEHARLLGIQDLARLYVDGWDNGYPLIDGTQRERELIDRLRDAIAATKP